MCVIVSLWFSSHWWIFPSLFAASALATFVFFSLRPSELVIDANALGEAELPPLGYGRCVGGVVLAFSMVRACVRARVLSCLLFAVDAEDCLKQAVLVTLIVLSSLYPSNTKLDLAETYVCHKSRISYTRTRVCALCLSLGALSYSLFWQILSHRRYHLWRRQRHAG